MALPQKFKALILDFDGTLAQTLQDIACCMAEAFQQFGEPAPSEDAVRAIMSVPLEIAIPRLLGKECASAEAAEWVLRYRSIYNGERLRRTSLFPGAKELLLRAEETNTPAVLVSNKGSVAVAAELHHLGVAHLIRKSFPVDAAPYKKPDPRLYHSAIKSCLHGVPDSEVLVVGDSDADIRFAQNAGLRCCWAAYGYGNPEECLGLKPDMVVQCLTELLPLIGR